MSVIEAEPFRVDILARGESTWANNALTFGTRDEALEYAKDLARRWMMADKYRVVPVSTPKHEEYVVGSEDGAA